LLNSIFDLHIYTCSIHQNVVVTKVFTMHNALLFLVIYYGWKQGFLPFQDILPSEITDELKLFTFESPVTKINGMSVKV